MKKRITANKLKVGIAAAFMMFGFSSVSAAAGFLQEAIKQALQNKAEAKKAALQVKKAEYKIDEAKAGALPQISNSRSYLQSILQESLLEFESEKSEPSLDSRGTLASVQLQQDF
jgi:outer membrane protein TolC